MYLHLLYGGDEKHEGRLSNACSRQESDTGHLHGSQEFLYFTTSNTVYGSGLHMLIPYWGNSGACGSRGISFRHLQQRRPGIAQAWLLAGGARKVVPAVQLSDHISGRRGGGRAVGARATQRRLEHPLQDSQDRDYSASPREAKSVICPCIARNRSLLRHRWM